MRDYKLSASARRRRVFDFIHVSSNESCARITGCRVTTKFIRDTKVIRPEVFISGEEKMLLCKRMKKNAISSESTEKRLVLFAFGNYIKPI